MSAITDERRPDDASSPDDATPPGGRPGRDALRQMGSPHRARHVKDRIARVVMWFCFFLAMIPLVWILWTVISKGAHLLGSMEWWTGNQRNINSDDASGGARHAIEGTLQMVGVTALIAVPIGILTAVYLVEYGRGALARVISFTVDILSGIPSIVAALFIYAVWVTTFGISRSGFAASLALVLLMIPVIVRSTEEMLKLVPNELREAAYALGVPKWLTIVKVVIPTSIAGITTGVTLAIARVIGETAPLLIIAGFTQSMNYDLFNGRMMALPLFVYTQYANPGTDVQAYLDRAWAAALTLILIVMALNLIARLVARIFSPKLSR